MTSSFSISRPRRLSPHSASGRAPRIFVSAFVRIDSVTLVQLDIGLIGCLSRSLTIAIARCHQNIRKGGYDLFSAVLCGSASIDFRGGAGERFVFHISYGYHVHNIPFMPKIFPSNVSIKSSLSEDPKKKLNAKKHFIMAQLSSIQDWRCGVASTTLRANRNTAAKSRRVAMEQLSNMIF